MTDAASTQLTAAILAGGASRRMGRDKALEIVDGRTLLERAVRTSQMLTDDVLVVGFREPYLQFGVPVLVDQYPGAGPLGGIVTALRAAHHDYVLVVACDLPLLSVPLLQAMASLPRDYDVLVPVTSDSTASQPGDGTMQALHAIYRRRCLTAFEAALQHGERQVVAAFGGLSVRELPESRIREYDPNLRSFMNANRPADLELARELAGKKTGDLEEPG